jgi:hypothetical protein
MSFFAVIFVVLMILALFGGGYAWRPIGPTPNYGPFGAWFMLWLCVAILGYIVLAGGGAGTMVIH